MISRIALACCALLIAHPGSPSSSVAQSAKELSVGPQLAQYPLWYVLQTRVPLRYPPYQCYCYSVSRSAVFPSSVPVGQAYSRDAAIARRNLLATRRGTCPGPCSRMMRTSTSQGQGNGNGHAYCRRLYGTSSYPLQYYGNGRWRCHVPKHIIDRIPLN